MRARILVLGLLLLATFGAAYWWWVGRVHSPGAYEQIALQINSSSSNPCDAGSAQRRVGLAKVIDRYRSDIQGLWQARKSEEFPEFKMERVGPVFLRVNKKREEKTGFDSSTWGWEEAFGLYLRTQRNSSDPENIQRWRDLDTLVRFLLEKDVSRVLRGRKFLTPDIAVHTFRPNPSVRRVSRTEFEVKLDPGDFEGDANTLKKLFEKEWRSHGKKILIEWAPEDPAAYQVRALFRSGRSYVSHREKSLVIANFSWVRTVAHELGHVLGFDDHYYSVWNDRNCYYTQESRLSDLMSSSDQGGIVSRHWALLEEAYPWKGERRADPFSYQFGKN